MIRSNDPMIEAVQEIAGAFVKLTEGIDGETRSETKPSLLDSFAGIDNAIRSGFSELANRIGEFEVEGSLVNAVGGLALSIHSERGESLSSSINNGAHEIAEAVLDLAKAIREVKAA